jgi:DNA polymerase-3 subunit delta'
VPFSELQGQDNAARLLKGAIARGALHHAYLFAGPEGVGKERCATLFAQALNCETGDADACGRCASCTAIARGAHRDVLRVGPEGASRVIKVEQVREAEALLQKTAWIGRRKVVILAPADALNEQAQNAFLKTLEEPAPNSTLILVSAAPQSLLPTTRSRCLLVRFAPLDRATCARLVRAQTGCDDGAAEEAAALAGGSLGEAVRLARDPERVARRRALVEAAPALDEKGLGGALELAEPLADRASALEAVSTLRVFLRDALVAAEGAPATSIVHTAMAGAVTRQAQKGPRELLRRIALLDDAEEALVGNGNPRLWMERVFIGFQGVA